MIKFFSFFIVFSVTALVSVKPDTTISTKTTTDLSEVNDLRNGNFSSTISKNIEDIDNKEVEESTNGTWTNNEKVVKEVSQNVTLSSNDTLSAEFNETTVVVDNSNITALPSIMEGTEQEGGGGGAIGTSESAMILAGVFVVLAAAGYGGMLAWRRVLQVRYGNSEILITDDVYDISDLRNFEI